MFGTIRRHQQWIWIPIVAVTILTFVWFFTPNGSDSGRAASLGQVAIVNGKPATINGQTIPMDEFRSAYRETFLGHFFRSNGKEWPDGSEASKEMLDHDSIVRVFMLHKLKELDIEVSDEAAARLAMERLGNYPPSSLEKDHLLPHGLNLADFDRFMRHEAAIQQLVGTVTASAKLIKPQEAESLYRKDHEEFATDLAAFWTSNYLDKVTVTPVLLTNYYLSHQANYRVPERVQISYVEFAASNYLAEADKQIAQITNFSARVDEMYYKRGTNSIKDTNGVALPEAAAKAKIKEETQHEFALVAARRKASEFGNELISQPDPDRADNLVKMAAARNLAVKVTPPFDRTSGLDDTNFPPEFREKALKLTMQSPVSFSPIVGEEAVYVISLKARVPSEMPSFEKVQEKVAEDYKNFQAWEMARTTATGFASSVTNGLAQKKAFADLCAQANVKPQALTPFSASTSALTNLDERINFYMIQHLAASLKPGEASSFYPLPRQEGGIVLYLRAKLPVDESKVKAELPEFIGRLRMYRQNEDFNQWFNKQAELAKLVIPRKETPSISPRQMN